MTPEPTAVTVRILDKDYLVSCQPEEKDGLLSSARHVDERMRDIRKSGRVIGTDRIAVMAALNLAYELLQKGQQELSLDAATTARLAGIQGRIEAALSVQDTPLTPDLPTDGPDAWQPAP